MQSQHKGRRRAPNGDKRDEDGLLDEPSGSFPLQRTAGHGGETEGQDREGCLRGPAPELIYNFKCTSQARLERDVGLARPVGVDCYAGYTGAACG